MRDMLPSDFAKAQLDELLTNERVEMERSVSANQRWVLSLAVGNGAALAAVVAKIIDVKTESLTALMMPSCWLFAVGLLCVGAVTPITAERHRIAVDMWKSYTRSFREGEDLVPDSAKLDRDRRLFWIEMALEWASAAFFALGLLRPLAILTLRYFSSESGFFPDIP